MPLSALPAFMLVGSFTIAAMVSMVRASLSPTLLVARPSRMIEPNAAAWRRVTGDPHFWDAWWFTVRVATLATLLSVAAAVVLVLVLRPKAFEHPSSPPTTAFGWLAVPIAAPHLVVAAVSVAWLAPGGLGERILGWALPVTLIGDRAGLGIILVYCWKEIPFLTLVGLATLDHATAELERTSALLGAGPLRRSIDVVLPRLALPLVGFGLLVMAFVVGAVEVPVVVGSTRPGTLGTYALDLTRLHGPIARADVAVVHLASGVLVGLLGLLGSGLLIIARRARAAMNATSRRRHTARGLLVLMVAPLSLLVIQSFADQWYGRARTPNAFGLRGVRAVWSDPTLLHAIVNSITVAACVAVLAVVMAWPAARTMAVAPTRTRWLLLVGPVLLPPLLMGEGLARVFAGYVPVRGLLGLGVAHLIMTIPYAVLALRPVFSRSIIELDHTAALLGTPPLRRTLTVIVPAVRRQTLLAFGLAFTVSWSQYGTSLAVGRGAPMLPLLLVPFIRSDPQVAAVLSLIFLVPPAALLAVAARGRQDFG